MPFLKKLLWLYYKVLYNNFVPVHSEGNAYTIYTIYCGRTFIYTRRSEWSRFFSDPTDNTIPEFYAHKLCITMIMQDICFATCGNFIVGNSKDSALKVLFDVKRDLTLEHILYLKWWSSELLKHVELCLFRRFGGMCCLHCHSYWHFKSGSWMIFSHPEERYDTFFQNIVINLLPCCS